MYKNLWSKGRKDHFGALKKLLLVMKLIVLILTAAIVQVSAATYGQSITLKKERAPLGQVIRELRAQSGYDFFLDRELLDRSRPVTVDIRGMEFAGALERIFAGQPLAFEISVADKSVVIRQKEVSFLDRVVAAWNAIDFSGFVLDEKGLPIAGATVSVQGKKLKTVTDSRGQFFLGNVAPEDMVEISFVGYQKIYGKAGELNGKALILRLETNELQEVTVNKGYYTEQQKLTTGNVAKVSASQIANQPISNPIQALQGTMAGVQVTQTTGVAGGGFNVQIRGRNSLRSEGNYPLYIVDGVPFSSTSLTQLGKAVILEGSPLNTIHPNDIESIEVLKDADATAIYGSRGGNGVVLITTKKGKVGRTQFHLDVATGVSQVGRKLEMMGTQDYLMMRREAMRNDNLVPAPADYPFFPDLYIWDQQRDVDWQRELIGGTGKVHNLQGTVSGGNANTQFVLASHLYREGTVFPGDMGFQRGGGRLNLNHKTSDGRLNIGLTVNFTKSNSDYNSVDLTKDALFIAPNTPAGRLADGSIDWYWNVYSYSNPYIALERRYENSTDQFSSNLNVDYRLGDFKLGISGGYNSMEATEISMTPLSSILPIYRGMLKGSANHGSNSLSNWILEPQLNYRKSFSKSSVDAIVGGTFQQSLGEGNWLSARGYTNDELLHNLLMATSITINGENYAKYRYSAVFARANYNYDNKYVLNLTGRRDGSSRFGPGRQFANFYAIGGAWIFSNEKFAKGFSLLSHGKLRVSYGLTGNDNIGNYQYLNTYSGGYNPYLGTPALQVSRLYNPDYSWETNRKLELGLELGLLKDRLFASFSYFRNRSADQLVGQPMAATTGFESMQANFPAVVQNSGLEVEFRTENITGKAFRWSTSFNLTVPRNRLVSFPGIAAFPAYNSRYEVGRSIFVQRQLKYTGIDPATGLYTFADLNGDGSISDLEDGSFIKEVSQRFFGGLANTLSYRGFQLDFNIQFVKQTGFAFEYGYELPGGMVNQPKAMLDRWTGPGSTASRQRYTMSTATEFTQYKASDASVVDASFVRLKNANLSWQMPGKWTGEKLLARVFVQGQNLLTLTEYLGLDPENQSTSSLPPLRTVSIGFKASF